MRSALRGYQILGVQTNIGFLSSLLNIDAFVVEDFDTGFIEKHHEKLFNKEEGQAAIAVCVAAMAVLPAIAKDNEYFSCLDPWSPWQDKSGWRLNQPPRHRIKLSQDEVDHNIEITPVGDQWRICFDQNSFDVRARWLDDTQFQIEIDSSLLSLPVLIKNDNISIWHNNQEWRFTLHNPMQALDHETASDNQFVAPMPGAIITLPVSQGDVVEAGDILLIMEAMKMEHSMIAPVRATVVDVYCSIGDQVEEGDRLITLEPVES